MTAITVNGARIADIIQRDDGLFEARRAATGEVVAVEATERAARKAARLDQRRRAQEHHASVAEARSEVASTDDPAARAEAATRLARLDGRQRGWRKLSPMQWRALVRLSEAKKIIAHRTAFGAALGDLSGWAWMLADAFAFKRGDYTSFAEFERQIANRYGVDFRVPPTDAMRALERVGRLVRVHAEEAGFERLSDHLSDEQRAEIEAKRYRLFSNRFAGTLIGVTAEEVLFLGLTTFIGVDESDDEVAARRAEAKREREFARSRRRREAAGATPREEYEANSTSRAKPWEAEGISRRTWYRRQAAERGTGPTARNTIDRLEAVGVVPSPPLAPDLDLPEPEAPAPQARGADQPRRLPANPRIAAAVALCRRRETDPPPAEKPAVKQPASNRSAVLMQLWGFTDDHAAIEAVAFDEAAHGPSEGKVSEADRRDRRLAVHARSGA
ncbi:MAG: hypothetical protein HC900_00875 [Methylacidiphilales bacterium]|nr:hypothetical protein [Candidatus Methylacidiphilales bacterium]